MCTRTHTHISVLMQGRYGYRSQNKPQCVCLCVRVCFCVYTSFFLCIHEQTHIIVRASSHAHGHRLGNTYKTHFFYTYIQVLQTQNAIPCRFLLLQLEYHRNVFSIPDAKSQHNIYIIKIKSACNKRKTKLLQLSIQNLHRVTVFCFAIICFFKIGMLVLLYFFYYY